MNLMRKHNTATTFLVPVIKAGGNDFAASADWTPAVGDVKVSQDEGAFANIGTLPTAVGNMWKFTLSASEMNAARVAVQVVDSATKAVEDQSILIETYGAAGAQHAFDLDSATAAATLSTSERDAVADAMLDRDMGAGTDTGSPTKRTVRQALRFLRNKWSITGAANPRSITVYKEDDTTSSWTASANTTAGDPVSDVDPA